MSASMVSTKEVAGMLHVTETTVKRWSDENLIPCVRTAGGHRKFLLKDVTRFAESQGYTASGAQPPPMAAGKMERLQAGVVMQDYPKIAGVLREVALESDREALQILLLYLSRQHIHLPVVLDDIIRPVFQDIGREWEQGELEISQEHAASQAMTEALVRTVADLHRKESNNKSAVCACVEGELHEIGLHGLAYSLECEGWNVLYLGANTPADTLVSYIRANRPQLVCLSATTLRKRASLAAAVKRIASRVHAYNGKLILGGNGTGRLHARDLGCDHIASSIQDAISYLREVLQLKPGPKKGSEQN